MEPTRLDDDQREAPGPSHLRLGEILIRHGLIEQDDLALALAHHDGDDHDLPLGRRLIERGAISEATLTRALAEQSGLPVVDLDLRTPDPALVAGLCEEVALRLLALPLERRHDVTVVAVGAPPTRDFRREISRVLHAHVDFVLAVPSALRVAIARAYATPPPTDEPRDEPHAERTDEPQLGLDEVDEVGTALTWLLSLARDHRAHALQLHAEGGGIRVRARIERDMRDLVELPAPAASLLVRRVLAAFGLPSETTRVDGATCVSGVPGFGPALSLTAAPTTQGSIMLIRPVGLPAAPEGCARGLGVARQELARLLAGSQRGLVVLVCTDRAMRRSALRALALDPIMHTRSVGTVGVGADRPMPRVSQLDPGTIGGFAPTLRLSLDLGNDVVIADIDDGAGPEPLRAVVDAALDEPVIVLTGVGTADVSAAIATLVDAAGAPLVATTLELVVHIDATASVTVLRVSDELREAIFDGRRPV